MGVERQFKSFIAPNPESFPKLIRRDVEKGGKFPRQFVYLRTGAGIKLGHACNLLRFFFLAFGVITLLLVTKHRSRERRAPIKMTGVKRTLAARKTVLKTLPRSC